MIPTPTFDSPVASLPILMMRHLLARWHVSKKKTRCKDLEIDESNLDCLMRLPLGRHAVSKAVAWRIDLDTATVIVLDQQAEAVAHVWNYGGLGCEPLEASREALEMPIDEISFDYDKVGRGSYQDATSFTFLAFILAKVIYRPLVRPFHTTCDAWCIPCLRPSVQAMYQDAEETSSTTDYMWGILVGNGLWKGKGKMAFYRKFPGGIHGWIGNIEWLPEIPAPTERRRATQLLLCLESLTDRRSGAVSAERRPASPHDFPMTTHISARVAWHMDGWNGHICKDPAANTYCVGCHFCLGQMIRGNFTRPSLLRSIIGLGCAELDPKSPVRPARVGQDRRQGHQPLRG